MKSTLLNSNAINHDLKGYSSNWEALPVGMEM